MSMRGSMLPDRIACSSLASSALVFLSRKFTPQKVSLGIRSWTATPNTLPSLARRIPTTNACPKCLARNEIGQLELASDARVSFHVQQTTLSVHLLSLRGFFEALAASLLPLRLYRNDDWKTVAPPLFRSCRL